MARVPVRSTTGWRGLLCPADPEHGRLVGLASQDGSTLWHCPHQAHDGRPKTHPLGALPMSRATFRLDEVEAAMAAHA